MATPTTSAPYRLIYELGNVFASQLELEPLLQLVTQKCREVLDAEGASILLLDASGNELYFPYLADLDTEVARRLAGLKFPATQGIATVAAIGGVLPVPAIAAVAAFTASAPVPDRAAPESGALATSASATPLSTVGSIPYRNARGLSATVASVAGRPASATVAGSDNVVGDLRLRNGDAAGNEVGSAATSSPTIAAGLGCASVTPIATV